MLNDPRVTVPGIPNQHPRNFAYRATPQVRVKIIPYPKTNSSIDYLVDDHGNRTMIAGEAELECWVHEQDLKRLQARVEPDSELWARCVKDHENMVARAMRKVVEKIPDATTDSIARDPAHRRIWDEAAGGLRLDPSPSAMFYRLAERGRLPLQSVEVLDDRRPSEAETARAQVAAISGAPMANYGGDRVAQLEAQIAELREAIAADKRKPGRPRGE